MAGKRQNDTSGIELGRFLRARRTQLSPEDAGLTVGPGWRRTPGLRREELASLAGVSVDYYTRLERGKETRPSPAVVGALARALKLGEQEHAHLFELVTRAAHGTPRPRGSSTSETAGSGTELLLERLRPYPARVLSRTMDVLAWNPGGIRTLPGMEDWPIERYNITRYVFLHPGARDLFADFEAVAAGCMARLRALGGTDPDAPGLAELIEELQTGSAEFAQLWERYEVRSSTLPSKTMHHPEVGTMTLNAQSMQLDGTPGHRLVVYYADPGTPDHDAIVLLDQLSQDRITTPTHR